MVETRLYCGDCLEVMPQFENNSIDLIVTDPPYYKVKGEYWDRQWETADQYLKWFSKICEQWQRILKPNGSLYVFASPKMAARVECEIGKLFNVLNHIVWSKSNEPTHALLYGDDRFRQYVQKSERIIFAEHYNADSCAKGETGYQSKCDDLRGFVFEPIRLYLDNERRKAGVNFEAVRQIVGCANGSGLPSHWFTKSQWSLPTKENYLKLRNGFSSLDHGENYLQREWEDLHREYEDLHREYEDLRRPFCVSANVPYTDVWDFPTVSYYSGKHPCEKPLEMLEHIITVSSKTNATVLDCFMGTGNSGIAAYKNNRNFIGIDITSAYYDLAVKRIEQEKQQLVMSLKV